MEILDGMRIVAVDVRLCRLLCFELCVNELGLRRDGDLSIDSINQNSSRMFSETKVASWDHSSPKHGIKHVRVYHSP